MNLENIRIVERFLFFPKTINNERKWLVKAKWLEKRELIAIFNKLSGNFVIYRWRAIEWEKYGFIN